jgi:DNA helicase TIP49 (TBP-interacting protein)
MLGIKSEKEVSDLIDWLDLKIRKGKYTDEKFKLIEQQILTLKSLCIEPDTTTQVVKPNKINSLRYISQLKQFNQSLKS